MRLTDRCHAYVKEVLVSGDIAIDATVGNGHDTCFLVNTVGETGKVFGFDIQQQAIANTQQRLIEQQCDRYVELFCTSHAMLKEYVPESYHGGVKVIMFNLGYLPGTDKKIITMPDSTLAAFSQSLDLLQSGGSLVVMVYTGHDGGDREWQEIKEWFTTIDEKLFNVVYPVVPSPCREVPKLFAIQKM